MHFLRALPLIFLAAAALAAPPVYRCESAGKIGYSDAPCVGATTVDVTPTQGADKLTGSSRKGKEVRTTEFHNVLDKSLQRITGKSHDEMDVMRRRFKRNAQDQSECTRLDGQLPDLEGASASATGGAKGRADVALYQARKRFFDLKC